MARASQETLVSTGCAGPNVERERQRWEERVARVRRGLIDGILDNETAKAAIREAEAALHRLAEARWGFRSSRGESNRHPGALAAHDGGRKT